MRDMETAKYVAGDAGAPHSSKGSQVERCGQYGPLGRHVCQTSQEEPVARLLLLDNPEHRLDYLLPQLVCLFARRGGHPSAVAPQRRVVRPNGYVAACCCTDWTAGCRYSMRDASLPPKRRPQVQGSCETASRLPQVMPSGLQTPEGLSEPRETAPEPLTMVAAANGHGSVIDDADVVSMTVTTAPRRPTFLQQVRWDAVQQAKLEGMSIRKMARDLGLHRDTVRRYIDVESPPTRRSRATPATVPSDTIPE